ncbi:SigE family RNA polymerase sigma factor [Streptomyces sp. CA-106110]|uniref:SigE family RNA polymerase sigma factor n=1 Tax=Streptomyces sp. CA-106110 TaxID=3240044 RepID=UPI003D94D426
MARSRDVEFHDFVSSRWSAVFHFARLLTGGDRYRAEDLMQEAFVKLWFAWPRVGQQAPEPYIRKVLARAAMRSARRRWWAERPADLLPERADTADETTRVDERARLEAALALLPARQRTAVVLRYYQDLSESQVAEAMGCPLGTARSLVTRGVARLRQAMAETAEPVK